MTQTTRRHRQRAASLAQHHSDTLPDLRCAHHPRGVLGEATTSMPRIGLEVLRGACKSSQTTMLQPCYSQITGAPISRLGVAATPAKRTSPGHHLRQMSVARCPATQFRRRHATLRPASGQRQRKLARSNVKLCRQRAQPRGSAAHAAGSHHSLRQPCKAVRKLMQAVPIAAEANVLRRPGIGSLMAYR